MFWRVCGLSFVFSYRCIPLFASWYTHVEKGVPMQALQDSTECIDAEGWSFDCDHQEF